ncbi:unnamed protein product, partial [Dovyalis caffra]
MQAVPSILMPKRAVNPKKEAHVLLSAESTGRRQAEAMSVLTEKQNHRITYNPYLLATLWRKKTKIPDSWYPKSSKEKIRTDDLTEENKISNRPKDIFTTQHRHNKVNTTTEQTKPRKRMRRVEIEIIWEEVREKDL